MATDPRVVRFKNDLRAELSGVSAPALVGDFKSVMTMPPERIVRD
jgi:hypothetical protein